MAVVNGTVVCPHCGNVTPVKSGDWTQKCVYCRRLFRLLYWDTKYKKRCDPYWAAEAVDFDDKPSTAHTGFVDRHIPKP